ncbi:MAG: hypothetical protein H7Y38_17320, partial [Armatimonadetes bacterium]|nr:hypothetical protein [Armatimonadota bacterium]
VTSLTVKLWGAGGASGGGSAAFVTGSLAVTPGSTLTIIGGGFSNGFGGYGGGDSGTGGGGRSGIQFGGTELVTAAGGCGTSSINGGGGGLTTGNAGDGPQGGGGTQTAGGNGIDTFQSGSAFQGGFGIGGGGGGGNPRGDGGSSYFTNAKFTFSMANSQNGANGNPDTGKAPGGAGDSDYVARVGTGGNTNTDPDGGNGLVVINAVVTVPESGSLALLLPALGAVFCVAKSRLGTVVVARKRK